jgi:hypothetical protein
VASQLSIKEEVHQDESDVKIRAQTQLNALAGARFALNPALDQPVRRAEDRTPDIFHCLIRCRRDYVPGTPLTNKAPFYPAHPSTPQTSPWHENLNQDGGYTRSGPVVHISPLPPDTRGFLSQTNGLSLSRRCLMVVAHRFVDHCRLYLKILNPTTPREPAPTYNYGRINIGDVGFIRRGQFHLLFSAGSPLGERQLGEDVPVTFEELAVGTPVSGQPRLPGCLHTDTVREVGAGLGATASTTVYVPSIKPSSTSFKHTTQNPGTWRKFLIRAHWKPWCGAGDEVSSL